MTPISNKLWLSLLAFQAAWFRLTVENAPTQPAAGNCCQSILALSMHRVKSIGRHGY